MKVLITGLSGQLARSLVERAASRANVEVTAVGRPELDLEIGGTAERVIAAAAPDVVINTSAYTSVDEAEDEPERAFRVNAGGAGEVAAAAVKAGAPIIQISTDYVFDGRSSRPYMEADATGPINAYGASKLAGEEAVRTANPDHLIVRTSWVYSPFASNFVRTMLHLAGERNDVRVVADQHGCPTSGLDLADALLRLAERRAAGDAEGWGETYHLAGHEACSWAEFAQTIFRCSAAVGGPAPRVVPIGTAERPTPAARPASSVLDCRRFERVFGLALPPFEQSLKTVVRRILATP